MAKILIVDDRRTNRQSLLTALGGSGHELLEAIDGSAALTLIRAERPDLMITDFLMPTLNGYELTQRVRSEPDLAATPVMFYTAAFREPEARALANTCGVRAVLHKPSTPQAILAAVNHELGLPAALPAEQDPAGAVSPETHELRRIDGKLADYLGALQDVKAAFDDLIERVAPRLGEPELVQQLSVRFSENLGSLRRLSSRLAALVEVTFDVRPEQGPAQVIRLFFEAACNMIPSRFAAAGVLDEATSGLNDVVVKGVDAAIYGGAGGHAELLATLGSQRGTHRIRVQGPDDSVAGLPGGHPAVRSFLGASIASQDHLFGWIYFADKLDDAEFSDEDERIVAALANAMALFYGNATLYDLVQRNVAQLSMDAAKRGLAEKEAKARDHQQAQAQKMEAVGQLSGGIAHDFNNILSVVVGNLELLIETVEGQSGEMERQVGAFGGSALDAALRGAELVRQLLAISRNQPLHPRPIDFGKIVAGLEPLLRRSLGEQVTLDTRAEADLWLAVADPAQLESVILNLAINGRDAMPRGGTLTVASGNISLDQDAGAAVDLPVGDYVTLSVSDIGTGIPAEVLPRIFEPFFTTKVEGKGTGLGLPMVYGFARQSGGTVKIYTELGVGTEMRLYLPRASADATGQQAVVGPRDVSLPKGHERILVVDDKPEVRRVARMLLDSLGYTVIEADSPSAALDAFDRGVKIDLLFTDVVMPGGMNGIELAEEVRRRFPTMPIVFTSGFTNPQVIQKGSETLEATIVRKPYRKADLAMHLSAALDRARVVSAAALVVAEAAEAPA